MEALNRRFRYVFKQKYNNNFRYSKVYCVKAEKPLDEVTNDVQEIIDKIISKYS